MTDDSRMVVKNERPGYVSPLGLMSEMDDLFDSFRKEMDSMLFEPWRSVSLRPVRLRRAPLYMPMNMVDNGEELELTVDIPGVKKDDVSISIDEDILTIDVDSKEEKEEKDASYLLKERSTYRCQRSVKLPVDIVQDKVEARMADGVLHLKLPKLHPKKKEKLEIKVK